jgi:hypothetical protein
MSKDGYINIPKGYLWCNECDALTPHKKLDDASFSWQEDYRTCVICDRTVEFEQEDCPECGWRYMNYEDPPEHNVQVHHPGCHYNDEELNDECFYSTNLYSHAESVWDEFIRRNFQFRNVKEIKCSCPTYEIITDAYCYHSVSGYGSGMDCYDDRWWTLYIRCPICGELFEINDGSC